MWAVAPPGAIPAALLASAEEWIVVGYSAPNYDKAACDLLAAPAGASTSALSIQTSRRRALHAAYRSSRELEGDLANFVAHG